jgi:TRAP-type uncharacterized transport system substrate-binding protein
MEARTAAFAARTILFIIPLLVACALIAGAASIFLSRTKEGQRPTLTIYGSDDSGSPYALFASYLHRRLTDDPRVANVVRVEDKVGGTTGSLQTLGEIEKKTPGKSYGLGIAQSDVLYHYVKGEHPQLSVPKETSDVRSIARLFAEWVDVSAWVAPEDSGKTADELLLMARDVCAEQIGSGSFVTALNIGRALGLPWTTKIRPCKRAEGGNPGTLSIQVWSPSSLQRLGSYQSIGLRHSAAQVVVSAYPHLYAEVEKEAFAKQYRGTPVADADRTTVSVYAVLVTNRDLPVPVAESLRCILEDLDRAICDPARIPDDSCSDLDRWKEGNALYYSQQIAGFKAFRYCDKPVEDHADKAAAVPAAKWRTAKLPIARLGASVSSELDRFSRLLIRMDLRPLAAIAMLLVGLSLAAVSLTGRHEHLMPKAIRWLARFSNRWKWQLVLVGVAHVLVGLIIWVAEFHSDALSSNSDFVSGGAWGAMFWVLRFVTTGENPYKFQSIIAIAGIACLKGGWAAIGIGFSVTITKHLVRLLQGAKMSNHTIIIGWNERGDDVRAELKTLERPMYIIGRGNNDDTEEEGTTDAITDATLKKAGLGRASAVVILGDALQMAENGDSEVDLWTARTVALVRQVEKDIGRSTPVRIVAEVVRPANYDLIRRVGSVEGSDDACEVSCMQRWGARYLAQMTVNPTIGSLFETLSITIKKSGSYELYHLTFEELGRTEAKLGELRAAAAATGARSKAIPIAIRRDNKVMFAAGDTIKSGDNVLFIAEDRTTLLANAGTELRTYLDAVRRAEEAKAAEARRRAGADAVVPKNGPGIRPGIGS